MLVTMQRHAIAQARPSASLPTDRPSSCAGVQAVSPVAAPSYLTLMTKALARAVLVNSWPFFAGACMHADSASDQMSAGTPHMMSAGAPAIEREKKLSNSSANVPGALICHPPGLSRHCP